MRNYILFMNCEGDPDHPSHKDPVIMISIAQQPSDVLTMATMGLSMLFTDKDGDHNQLYLDPDKIREAREDLRNFLDKYLIDSEVEKDAFEGLDELDIEPISN